MRFNTTFLESRYFAVLCIMGAFAILSSTMSKSPALGRFADSLGTPADLLGIIASASTIPGILISLPAASLSDVVGRRKVLLFAAFVFASAPFLYIFVSEWWQLVAVRFYHGFATAIFVPVTEALVAERFPAKRGERISILSSATGLGRTIAPTLGGLILALTANSFHTLYLAVGTTGVTAFVLSFVFMSEPKKEAVEPASPKNVAGKMFQGWRTLALNRSVLAVSFVQASQYYVFGAVEFFIIFYMGTLTANSQLSALYAGVFLSVSVATLIVARPVFGRVSDRRGRRTPIIAGSLIGCLLLLAIPFTAQFPLLLLISVGYGLSFAMVVSSTSPLICELAPQGLVGASMGFLCTMMDIGQTLGAFVSGIILASFSQNFTVLFVSLSLIMLASTAVYAASRKHSELPTQS